MTPLAQYMHHALGVDNAVTVITQRLAEANLSTATVVKQQEQQKLAEVYLDIAPSSRCTIYQIKIASIVCAFLLHYKASSTAFSVVALDAKSSGFCLTV